MVILLEPNITKHQIEQIQTQVQVTGSVCQSITHGERTILVVHGSIPSLEQVRELSQHLEGKGLERMAEPHHGFQLASRELYPSTSVVKVNDVNVGEGHSVVIAGPCAVESREQILAAAHHVKAAGASMLRGGAYKPRSSPYSFQGMAEAGLQLLAEAREATGLPVVTEIIDADLLPMMQDYVDVFQVGARNMQNYALLKELGRANRPVLLKRGMSATIEEWLMSAEYILSNGNPNVILCERGIRTFEKYTRNTFDLNAVAVVKHLSHLPVIADPSHGTGVARYVTPMSLAAVAAGADGLIIEVHPDPRSALSDGMQSLDPDDFTALMRRVQALGEAMRSSAAAPTALTESDAPVAPLTREPVKMK